MTMVVDYVASNGMCYVNDIRQSYPEQAPELVTAFGNIHKADEALLSLYRFVVARIAA